MNFSLEIDDPYENDLEQIFILKIVEYVVLRSFKNIFFLLYS